MKITKQEQQSEKAEALAKLRALIGPKTTIYTDLNHVSASGMQRAISLYVVANDYEGKPHIRKLDYWAAMALGYAFHKKGGLKVGGCGMDMGFHLVYSLGQALWPNGTPEPHGTRNGEPDNAGGYALRHEWL